LKTTSNNLSTWRIDSQAELDEAVLALASESDHIDAIDVVSMNYNHLEAMGFCLVESKGNTPVDDLIDRHVDLMGLSYKTLGLVAHHIIERINEDKMTRYTAGQLKGILKKAIIEGRLKMEELKDDVKKKIKISPDQKM